MHKLALNNAPYMVKVSEGKQFSALAYRNFVDTCRTLATRQTYVKTLHYFMAYLHLSPGAYDRL